MVKHILIEEHLEITQRSGKFKVIIGGKSSSMKTVFSFRSLMFLARHRYFLAFFFPDLTVVDASADVFDDEDACLDNGSSSSESKSTAFDAFDASADVLFNAEGTCLDNGSSSSESNLSSDSVIAWLKSILSYKCNDQLYFVQLFHSQISKTLCCLIFIL